MRTKMYIHSDFSLIRSLRLASFKVCLCVIVLSVTVCTVGYVCLLCRDQIFVDFISFLPMIIYEVLYSLYVTGFAKKVLYTHLILQL